MKIFVVAVYVVDYIVDILVTDAVLMISGKSQMAMIFCHEMLSEAHSQSQGNELDQTLS